MRLIYPDVDYEIFNRFEDDVSEKSKVVWVFPDIKRTLGVVYDDNKNIVIDPSMYYVTSGEAIRKTEILISDLKDRVINYQNNERIVNDLTDMLINLTEFIDILKNLKNESKYLEITKCEDGIFSGNICSKKDPRKRKQV